MSNVKTLLTLIMTACFAAPSFAQDQMAEPAQSLSEDPVAANFIAADLDQDGSLNADEFVSFAVMRAEAGDETFKDVVIGGEYDETFTAHDADASGGIEMSELSVQEKVAPEPEMAGSDEEILEPEM